MGLPKIIFETSILLLKIPFEFGNNYFPLKMSFELEIFKLETSIITSSSHYARRKIIVNL